MKNRNIAILVICLTIPLLAIKTFFVCGFIELLTIRQYETTNIADYGEYTGIHNEEKTNELINSIFPKDLGSYFDDVKYVYRAEDTDSYAFEAYLEFTIADEAQFDQYVSDVTQGAQLSAFAYDANYQNYTIADAVELIGPYTEEEIAQRRYSIEFADIRHVLINDEENRIIYVALGVYDGGGATTAYLREFFTRFDIDPAEYAQGKERIAKG